MPDLSSKTNACESALAKSSLYADLTLSATTSKSSAVGSFLRPTMETVVAANSDGRVDEARRLEADAVARTAEMAMAENFMVMVEMLVERV